MSTSRQRLSASHIKILDFFYENPSCIDTPLGISLWTNENVKTVKKALEDLAALKILVAHQMPSTTGYSYTQDPAIGKKVEALLRSSKKQKT